MAHVAKYTRAVCGHMFKHYERAKDEKGEYIKFGNTDIDTTKTHLNYNLAPHRAQGQGAFVKERCTAENVFCMNRKDVNVLASWVVTQPKDLPPEKSKEFFEQTYAFLAKRYNEENVVSAYVHNDETTPHMHFAFVPITQNTGKKKGSKTAKEYTVSFDKLITRTELKAFHPALEKHLENYFGHTVGILNGATKEGNQTKEQLRQNDIAKKEYENIVRNTAKRLVQARETQEECNTLADKKERLKSDIKDVKETLEKYTVMKKAAEKVGSSAKKTIIGNYYKIPTKDYELEREQAKAYRANQDKLADIRETERMARMELEAARRKGRENEALHKQREESLNRREKSIEQKEALAERYYKEAEELWDEVTLGILPREYLKLKQQLTIQKQEIEKLKDELRTDRYRIENGNLKRQLSNSVPAAEYSKLKQEANKARHHLTVVSEAYKTEKAKNTALISENTALISENTALKEAIAHKDKTLTILTEKNRRAYESLKDVVKAARMLAHDGSGEYRVETLTEDQSRLIESITNYGSLKAKQDGYPEQAQEMKQYAGISSGIQAEIDELTPKTWHQTHRQYEYEGYTR